MFDCAGLPALITDSDFNVLFASTAARGLSPHASLPGGVRDLLSGLGLALDDVREEIKQLGSFHVPSVDWLFCERSTVICSTPDGRHYFLQPSPIPPQGTGTRPDGISRALAAFASQYRAPLDNIFYMLSLLGAANSDMTSKAVESATPSHDSTENSVNKFSEYLRVINDNAYRLLRANRWITDYSQLSNGIAAAHRRRIDLYGFLRELLTAADEHSRASGIPLEFDVPSGMLATVCDTGLLQNALLNILSNSYRFTRAGNRITVSAHAKDKTVIVSVNDRGAGIAPDVLPHVFEPYFSRDTDGTPFAGCGLGLTIARDSILALGGSLKLLSAENEGTTVVFTIPVYDDPTLPDTFRSGDSENFPARFSPLVVALSDSIRPPI